MKLFRLPLFIFLLFCYLFILAACGGNPETPETETSSTSNEQEIAVAVALTQTAAAPPTEADNNDTAVATPTLQPVATAETAVAPETTGTSFQGIQLDASQIDGSLTGELVARQPFGDGPGHGSGNPETIRFNYQAANTERPYGIDIFLVDEYLGIFPNEWEFVDQLKALTTEQPADPDDRYMPYLPPPNAQQMYYAQPTYIDFQNGVGVRYLTQFTQAPVPVEPVYTFQGLTNDGQYYISAWLPINSDALPPATEAEYQDIELLTNNNDARLALLDTLIPADFSPALDSWDTLIASLLVTPENFPSAGGTSAGEIERCTNDAEFVTDVTIPDNTELQPEETSSKVWRLRNTGTCTWTGNYFPTLIDDNDSGFGVMSMSKNPIVVPPGTEADVEVQLMVPFKAGTHTAVFQMQSANRITFGDTFYVQIEVPETEANKPATTIPEYGVIEGAIAFPSQGIPH